MKRYVAPTCKQEELSWRWSSLSKGEHISTFKVWLKAGKIAQIQIVGSGGTKLEPLQPHEGGPVCGGPPDSEVTSDQGFSALQVATAPRYSWMLFLAGIEVYEASLLAKRKAAMAAAVPSNVLRIFTPQGARFSGFGFGVKDGLLVAVGCEETSSSKEASGALNPGQTKSMVDVTAESVLFLTDSVVVISLILACVILLVKWFRRHTTQAALTKARA